MTGQDAANTAKAFDEALPLTGVVLTKTDGDARGGAALSIRQITGKPIKFLGVGEKTSALEPFHPERVASRILGMGDVLSLVEEVTAKVDHDKAAKLAKKIHKGEGFTLADFKEQMEQMSNMGGMAGLIDKLPGMGQVPDAVKAQVGDKEVGRLIAIVNSMTPQERAFPAMIKGSRKTAHRGGIGYPGAGCEQTAEAVHADAEGHEEDERWGHGQDDARHEGQDAGRFSRWRHAARWRVPVLSVRSGCRRWLLCLLASPAWSVPPGPPILRGTDRTEQCPARRDAASCRGTIEESLQRLSDALLKAEERNTEQTREIERLQEELHAQRAGDPGSRNVSGGSFSSPCDAKLPVSALYEVLPDRLVIANDPVFVFGKGETRRRGSGPLDATGGGLAQLVSQLPEEARWRLRIEGHSDNRPLRTNKKFESNWELSAARAVGMLRFLVAQGLPEDRLSAVGLADTHLRDPGTVRPRTGVIAVSRSIWSTVRRVDRLTICGPALPAGAIDLFRKRARASGVCRTRPESPVVIGGFQQARDQATAVIRLFDGLGRGPAHVILEPIRAAEGFRRLAAPILGRQHREGQATICFFV